jgi:hypothetical protein
VPVLLAFNQRLTLLSQLWLVMLMLVLPVALIHHQ